MEHLKLLFNGLNWTNMKKNGTFGKLVRDPHISRIRKVLATFCPKFLDLYASIYGSLILKGYTYEMVSVLPLPLCNFYFLCCLFLCHSKRVVSFSTIFVWVCVCERERACLFLYVGEGECGCECVSLFVLVCVCALALVFECMFAFIHVCVIALVCMCVYVFVCVCVWERERERERVCEREFVRERVSESV